MKTLKTIHVKFNFPGFHYWKDAPEEVAFLRDPHRHLFAFEISISVEDSDRELEFFMVQRELVKFIKERFKYNGFEFNFGPRSCEHIGEEILDFLQRRYPGKSFYSARVFEDDENGSTVTRSL